MFLKKRHSSHRKGFALVVTLSLMILLTIVAVGLLTLSSVSLRATTQSQAMAAAQANARMALMIALGELQLYAGPDQRVSASANIIPNGYAAGHAHWTGIWDTSAYDPKVPARKTFLRWLTSSKDPSQSTLTDAKTAASSDDVVIFKGKDDNSSVKVPKVSIRNSQKGDHAFAYWVEEEGIKADLRWNEGEFTEAAQKQTARLSASPGPDYERFEGPFTANVTHPLAIGTANAWLKKIEKSVTASDMQLVMDKAAPDWLRDKRHDMTFGSQGVLADVKKGGLRRDLSLAFEMDGSQDDPAQLSKFNSTIGEFVGTGSRTTDPNSAQYFPMPTASFYTRHLYTDVPRTGHLVRGPTWHAMRDFHNLYKRLTPDGDGYRMNARATYPDKTNAARGVALTELYINSGIAVTSETYLTNSPVNTNKGLYRYMPLRGNYSPVVLNIRFLCSIVAVDYNPATGQATLATCVDPIIYLWNPYGTALTVPSVTISFIENIPFGMQFSIASGTGNITRKVQGFGDYLLANANNKSIPFQFTITDSGAPLIMAPGEILVVSPTPPTGLQPMPVENLNLSSARYNFKASPGYNFSPGNGYYLTKMPVYTTDTNGGSVYSSSNIQLIDASPTSTTTLAATFSPPQYRISATATMGGGRFWYNSSLAGGNQPIQQMHVNISGPADGEEMSAGTLNSIMPSELLNRKNWLGQVSYYRKPTGAVLYEKSTGGTGTSPPVEVFGRFNPMPLSWEGTPWRLSQYDQFFSLSYGSSLNQLLGASGQSIEASSGRRGYWGKAYDASGSSLLPMVAIPSAPPLSLATFRHAALGLYGFEPLHPIGNSLSNPYLPGNLLADKVDYLSYGPDRTDTGAPWCFDSSWLINNSLWDRYFLSGIAPEYSIGASGYIMAASSATTGIKETLTRFFSLNPANAKANPTLSPLISVSNAAAEPITDLSKTDGYKKMAAYAVIDGAFNVNSTSTRAWAALLSANRDLVVRVINPASNNAANDSRSGIPFPKAASIHGTSDNPWQGFRRLSAKEIWDNKGTDDSTDDTGLAAEIVKQVKLRGPFQSISNFVNRSLTNDENGYWGAVQAAIQAAGLNQSVRPEGVTPDYKATTRAVGHFRNESPSTGSTSADINGSITQADILEPIASRLSARSDTFRIRAYGEAKSGGTTARAYCEAVIQRRPEYLDPSSTTGNEPWDDTTFQSTLSPGGKTLTNLNKTFGRRFSIVQFRWLSSNEI